MEGQSLAGVGVGGVRRWSPVSEVQNGLDGVTTTCGDVTLEPREQGQKHVDSEALPLFVGLQDSVHNLIAHLVQHCPPI